jgi:hypothetical protein
LSFTTLNKDVDRLNNPNLLNKLQEATRGTVSDLELMKAAVNANNFQIPLETLGTLLEFAQRRARDTGESVDYLVNSIVTGIARKSPLILDNLGINIKRIQEEFQKTGDFAKAAMNVVEEELAKAGVTVDTHADKVDRMKAAWQNTWTYLGTTLVSIVDRIGKEWRVMFDTTELVNDQVNQSIAKQNQAAYDFEVSMIQDFRQRFASADKAGRDKIISQVEAEITITKQMRDAAFRNGLTDQANQFDRYLGLWNKFIDQIRQGAAAGNTLAGLDAEMKALNDLFQNTDFNDPKFKDIQKQIKDLEKKRNDVTGKSGEEAAKKQEADAKKAQSKAESLARKQESEAKRRHKQIVDDQKRLAEELEKIAVEMLGESVQRELARLDERFTKYRELAHGDKKQLLEVEQRYHEARQDIIRKAIGAGLKAERERSAEELKIQEKINQEKIARAVEYVKRLDAAIAAAGETFNLDQQAKRELDISRAKGKEKLDLQKEQLQREEDEEIKATFKKHGLLEKQEYVIQNIIDQIRQKYREKAAETEYEYWLGVVGQTLNFAQQTLDIYNIFAQAQTDKENRELERDRAVNDRKKKNLEHRLKSELVTQLEYDQQLQRIEKEQEAREREIRLRQFRREQAAQLAEAGINNAVAVTKTLAEFGPPIPPNFLAIAALAFTLATGVAQVIAISNKKPPTYAGGGKLKGPSHAENNGMPVTDPRTGKVEAYLEGGEGVTNKRTMSDKQLYNVSGTPSQIISLLNAKHGGVHWESGATLKPAWWTQRPAAINIDRVNSALEETRKFYATGGRFADTRTDSTSPKNNDPLNSTLLYLTGAISELQTELKRRQDQPIKAYVAITDIEAQQARLNAIRDDATLR